MLGTDEIKAAMSADLGWRYDGQRYEEIIDALDTFSKDVPTSPSAAARFLHSMHQFSTIPATTLHYRISILVRKFPAEFFYILDFNPGLVDRTRIYLPPEFASFLIVPRGELPGILERFPTVKLSERGAGNTLIQPGMLADKVDKATADAAVTNNHPAALTGQPAATTEQPVTAAPLDAAPEQPAVILPAAPEQPAATAPVTTPEQPVALPIPDVDPMLTASLSPEVLNIIKPALESMTGALAQLAKNYVPSDIARATSAGLAELKEASHKLVAADKRIAELEKENAGLKAELAETTQIWSIMLKAARQSGALPSEAGVAYDVNMANGSLALKR